ncbi:MAG: amidohydrolase, partial [Candidatus Limnocylindria bacterium]
MTARPELVIRGHIVLAAGADGFETAEAIAIADGRVVAAGSAHEIGTGGARVVNAGSATVIP